MARNEAIYLSRTNCFSMKLGKRSLKRRLLPASQWQQIAKTNRQSGHILQLMTR